MSGKKGKALALDLINELLDGQEIELDRDETEQSAQDKTEAIEASVMKPSAKSPKSSKASTAPTSSVPSIPSAPETDANVPELPPLSSYDSSVPSVDMEDPNDDRTIENSQPVEEDNTVPINQTRITQSTHVYDPEDKVRASVGRFGALRSSGQVSATEAALAQSESLRIAQTRLLELEREIERLRLQNEELAAAGETLRRRADELLTENQKRDGEYKNLNSNFEQEKQLLRNSKEAISRDLELQRRKTEELELRISSNIQKIRVRERELENRLELVKMESAALIRSKDEIILEHKRTIDQLNLELNNYRTKNQELNRQTNDKQEMLRRTVKALRLALSMLEGEEEAQPNSQRKAK